MRKTELSLGLAQQKELMQVQNDCFGFSLTILICGTVRKKVSRRAGEVTMRRDGKTPGPF